MSKVVGVLGDGAWGTAIALLLADNGCRVKLWCPNPSVATAIETTGFNERYLPGFSIPETIEPTTNLHDVLCTVEIIFEAIPVKYLRQVAKQVFLCAKSVQAGQDIQSEWVILSKGIEPETLLLPSEIVNDVLRAPVARTALLGPSFAYDLAKKDMTAVMLATDDEAMIKKLQPLLNNTYFKIFPSSDLRGAQLCAALKNVVALAVGIVEGAGFSDNAKAFIITRGLHEMAMLVEKHGGNKETVYDLAGVGDLVLTAMGKSGRNVEVGRRLGRGQSVEQILQETGYTPESFTTVYALPKLMQGDEGSLPLFQGVWRVVSQNYPVKQWLASLIS
jgi:glycerol-3-phosphate dehydrogenase (NAD(P)+)